MAIETDADRLAFFEVDDFGVMATITPTDLQYAPTDDPYDVAGIFDAHSVTRGVKQDNGYGRQAEIQSGQPMFRAPSAGFVEIRAGRALISIAPQDNLPAGFNGYVHDVQADGTGLTILVLKKD